MSSNTTVAITKEASGYLDSISSRTGLSKLQLASAAITAFFDPERNPTLGEALEAFEAGSSQAKSKLLLDQVIAHRSKDVR